MSWGHGPQWRSLIRMQTGSYCYEAAQSPSNLTGQRKIHNWSDVSLPFYLRWGNPSMLLVVYKIPMVSCRVALKSPQRIPHGFPWIGCPTPWRCRVSETNEWTGRCQCPVPEPSLKVGSTATQLTTTKWHPVVIQHGVTWRWYATEIWYDLVWFAFIKHKIAM